MRTLTLIRCPGPQNREPGAFANHPGQRDTRFVTSGRIRASRALLQTASLKSGERIGTADEPLEYIWFPEDGALSRLIHLLTGETVETGIVGSDGVLGLPLALGSTNGVGISRVQIDGFALVISAADFDEHVRRHGGPLLDSVLLYANLYLGVLGQLTACHCLHRIEQRLSRCILQLGDHANGREMRITHDTLAEFLGVHRPSITYALQAIVETGAISTERRRIAILNRAALVSHACECYGVIRSATARALADIRERNGHS